MDTIVTTNKMSTDILDMFPGIEEGDVLKPVNILGSEDSLSFLDKPGAGEVDKPEVDKTKGGDEEPKKLADTTPVDKNAADKILDSVNLDETDDDDDKTESPDAKAKGSRGGLTSYLKGKIEAGDFSAFDDWDEKKETIDQYLEKQPMKVLHQMLDENWKAKEQEIMTRTPQEFFEALPEELQYAAKYVADGGTDMKGLFAALAKVEQVKNLDITKEDGQIEAARSYLHAIGFGNETQIEDQIAEWKEGNRLEKKVKEIKPKLDDMQKEQVEYQLQQQEQWKKQQQAHAQAYITNVHKALEGADINGIKLDKRLQANLYNGLTQVAYPSASGKPTNLLGHLLDKVQYVEPNFQLLAEVTYLLADPEGYRAAIKQMGKNEKVDETVRKLKTEQQTGTSQGMVDERGSNEDAGGRKTKKLSRPTSVLAGWK